MNNKKSVFYIFLSHMIYSPSLVDNYGTDAFPAIADSIYAYKKNKSSELLFEEIKLQYSVLIYSIQSASSVLREFWDFSRYVY